MKKYWDRKYLIEYCVAGTFIINAMSWIISASMISLIFMILSMFIFIDVRGDRKDAEAKPVEWTEEEKQRFKESQQWLWDHSSDHISSEPLPRDPGLEEIENEIIERMKSGKK